MASPHTYKIEMDLETSTKTKQALSELRQSLGESGENLDEMVNAYKQLSKQVDDHEVLEKEVNKTFNKRISLYDKEIDSLIKELETKKDLSDAEKADLKAKIKQLDTQKKQLKIKQSEFKQERLQEKIDKSRRGIGAEILKNLKEQVSQSKLMQTLTDKELKTRTKIAKLIAKGTGALAKGGAVIGKGLGVAGAVGGALVGGAMAGAEQQADKERALQSLKSGIDPAVVDSVFIKSGADYSSIVNAINSLADVTKDAGLLTQGAVLELQNPGIGKLLLSTKNGSEGNISKLNNAIMQIKKQTGIQDMTGALEASTKARSVTRGQITQTQYLQAYASLSQAGIDEESINRIISKIASKKGDFIDNFNNADISAMVYDKQLRNRINNSDLSIQKLDLNKSSEASSAQSITEKLRAFELKKNEILVKMLPVAEKVLEDIEPIFSGDMLDKIADGLVKLFTTALPLLGPILEALQPVLDLLEPVLNLLQPVVEWLAKISSNFVQNFIVPIVTRLADAIKEAINPFNDGESLPQKAQGGLVTVPSICGESGPELVLPLNNPGRTQSIINNYTNTNTFNMTGTQTPLSLSQAISNNRFIRHASTF